MSPTLPTPSLARWLFIVAAMIFVMAVVGAITRLTESGLSIMEWAPFTGALPPFSEAEWQRLFALYQQTPEYQTQNLGMTLDAFKGIFWWEWIHRLWGRLIGFVVFVPFIWFALKGRLPRWLTPHLCVALLLGGAQGALGWFMVASGFAERTDVSQYRLAAHLSLALALFAYVLWLGLRCYRPQPVLSVGGRGLRLSLQLFLALLALTIISGAFVAGLNAGLIYNSYPLMDGALVPSGYDLAGAFSDPTTVQFHHRLLTALTGLWGLGLAVAALRQPITQAARGAMVLLGFAVLVQLGLGIATLLAAVPVWLGAAHQAGAILLLTLALIALYHLRPADDR